MYLAIIISTSYLVPFTTACYGIELYIVTFIYGVYMASFLLILTYITYYKLGTERIDVLKIKREITNLLGLWIPVLISWIILSQFSETQFASSVLIIIAFPLSWFLTSGLNLITAFQYKAYMKENSQETSLQIEEHKIQDDKNLNEEPNKGSIMLEELLNEPKFKEEFELFLKSEWSIENLRFVQIVDKFKTTWDSSDSSMRFQRAKFIFKKFIQQGPFQVNLTFDIPSIIEQDLNKAEEDPGSLSQNIFDAAQQEVFLILKSDCLLRFRKFKKDQRKNNRVVRRTSTEIVLQFLKRNKKKIEIDISELATDTP